MKISTICFPIRDGKVFLANKKRGHGANHLNGYGGKKQPTDVTIEDAAIREMCEEGGVTTTAEHLEKVAIIDFFEEDAHIFECHVFFCRDWEGEFRETEEMAAPESFDIGNLPFNRMWDADKTWLPLVFSGKKIRAKSRYDKGMAHQEKFEYESL